MEEDIVEGKQPVVDKESVGELVQGFVERDRLGLGMGHILDLDKEHMLDLEYSMGRFPPEVKLHDNFDLKHPRRPVCRGRK